MVAGMERSMLAGLQQRHLVTSLPHLTPNLYEMAALTQELDTQVDCFNHCIIIALIEFLYRANALFFAHKTDKKLF